MVHLARSGRCTGPVPVRKDMARGSLNKAEANADRLTQVEAHAAPVQFRWAAGDTRRLRDLPHHRETLPLALASHLSEAPQVIPEEAGPVKGLMCPFSSCSRRFPGTPDAGPESRCSARLDERP